MRLVILAPGSRGDVQPYLALAQALQRQRHHPLLVTTLDHLTLCRSFDIETAAVDINVADELKRVETNRAIEGGGTIASFRQFAAIAKRATGSLASVALEALRSADGLVTNFTTALVAQALAQTAGKPLVQAYNVPVTPTSQWPGALAPGLDFGPISRRLGHAVTRLALWSTSRASSGDAVRQLTGTAPALRPPGAVGVLPGPVVYGLSEAFMARPTDWPAEAELTGFWFVDEPVAHVDPALRAFVEAGAPPVCIGFGSMSTERPEEMSALVLSAAKQVGCRVVLLSGWAGLEAAEAARQGVFVAPQAPHGWLYPRCAAVVHHGGAGTTAAAVRAGVPAVVVPFHGDQPFWASRVHHLGLGPPPVARSRLTADRLAAALKQALTDAPMRERAAAVGAQVQREQGAARAAERVVALTSASRTS